jgi:acyl carrier protein
MSHTREEITQTVIGFIATLKARPVESITSATTFDELQMDSLDKINLSFEAEERFGISIPDDSLDSLKTVGDIVAGVERLQAKKV